MAFHHPPAVIQKDKRDPVTVIPGVGRGAVMIRGRNADGDVVISIGLDESADDDDKAFWIQAAREYARRKSAPQLKAI